MEVEVSKVIVGQRFRKDLGDLKVLAESITALGLLQPIGVSLVHGVGYQLVFGHRRLEAFKLLGKAMIPAKLVNVKHLLSSELDENVVRKDFLPSEAVAIAEAMRDEVEQEARKRKTTGSNEERKEARGNLPQAEQGRTRAIIAKRIGLSERTYDKARKVVEAARTAPDTYADLLERMDRSRSVDGAYGELVKRQDRQRVSRVKAVKGRYRTLIVDPPWHYEGGTAHHGSPKYATMREAELRAIPVPKWADDDCHLWLWTTNWHMPLACKLVELWGFSHKGILTWVKPSMGAGSWLRNTTEHCLLAVKGELPITDRAIPSHFEAEVGEHSAKPEAFYGIVCRASVGPIGEAFARGEPREGIAHLYKSEAGVAA
jgi:N6-adenosine-specific RNA methylase IME4/ParB-like chromosome segregation protein Spo0J